MTIAAHGRIQAWADGKEMNVTGGEKRPDGARVFKATIAPAFLTARKSPCASSRTAAVTAGRRCPSRLLSTAP